MRRTDFCHLTSSYEHPRLAGSRSVQRFRAGRPGSRLLHGRTSRFGGSHNSPLGCRCGRRCFPSQCVWTGPLTPLSPPSRSPQSSRSLSYREGRRDRPQIARVNERSGSDDPRCLPSSRTFAPRRPFERPAPDFTRAAALPPPRPLPTPLHLHEPFRYSRRLGRRPRVPLPAGMHASLGLGRRSPTSATIHDARAHPSSRQSSHASGTLAPLPAGTNRCQLRWPSSVRCRTAGLRATTRSRLLSFGALHLRGPGESWAEAFEQKRATRSFDDASVPFS
jgi:hypothetical protein